jgi:SnoaL-like domain
MLHARSCLVATFVLLSPSILLCQVKWNEANRREIEQTFDEYSQAFITKDYDKMRDLLQIPFLGSGDRRLASLESMDEVIKFYRSAREDLDTRGYKTSRVDLSDARITVLSPTRVLFNVRYRRYRVDGSLLEEVAGIYLMSKASGRWKIQGNIQQDPAEVGKVN